MHKVIVTSGQHSFGNCGELCFDKSLKFTLVSLIMSAVNKQPHEFLVSNLQDDVTNNPDSIQTLRIKFTKISKCFVAIE